MPNGGQIGRLIQESTEWVEEHGTHQDNLSASDKIQLATQGHILKEIKRVLALPIWAVAAALMFNSAVQTLKWILG